MFVLIVSFLNSFFNLTGWPNRASFIRTLICWHRLRASDTSEDAIERGLPLSRACTRALCLRAHSAGLSGVRPRRACRCIRRSRDSLSASQSIVATLVWPTYLGVFPRPTTEVMTHCRDNHVRNER